jgi:predicted NodU family carbamoyl transferase/GT2 family glycosyltransferase
VLVVIEPTRLDVFIVACDRDIKLLRHFFLSYQLFFASPGNIHLLIWRKDQTLLDQIECPANLIVHYKDEVQGLVADDFRNQMYLKLIADHYVESAWFWVVDADYLICAPLEFDDFCSAGKPNWFFRPWLDLPEKSWRLGTQSFLGSEIPYLFMDEPHYILSRSILHKFRQQVDVTNILTAALTPSEFIAYGAFAYKNYPHFYSWKDSSKDNFSCISHCVNQRPPTYSILNRKVSLEDTESCKYVVFWSHWDMADEKMRQFLSEAQQKELGQIRLSPSNGPIKLLVTPEKFHKQGPVVWDGCYSDGWVKKNSDFSIFSENAGFFQIELDVLECPSGKTPTVTIIANGVEQKILLHPGGNSLYIFIQAGLLNECNIKFDNGISEAAGGEGRLLYGKITHFKFQTSQALKGLDMSINLPQDIPTGSVLGLNYSGMHCSAIAIVAPDGEIIFAAALERFSRVKQDGRPPFALIQNLPWHRISKVAISTDKTFQWPENADSKLLQTRLAQTRNDGIRHGQAFYDFLVQIPCQKEFVCHQLAHAASAFWGSGFKEALCLTYDGGMCNSPWFGGLYVADRQNGIHPLDQFSALHFAKVTSLYTFVTALLGFTPNKHEGKITGLAAYGQPTAACRVLLNKWFEEDFADIESVMEWVFAYDSRQPPMLLTNEARIQPFRDAARGFSREELAATVQELAEQHVLALLARARALGWESDNICLAGGLFANVKINQRVVESGFKKLFVAPPMTDDGTALGAAWHVLSKQAGFNPQSLHSMYLGPSYTAAAISSILQSESIEFAKLVDPAKQVAQLLASGSVVAVFQGAMEFGPPALGNRTILAQATDGAINDSLNARHNRTEFMPFAPVSRVEDAEECYLGIDRVRHAAEFMTVTVNCTESMKSACPAVVHIDGTARPQLVSAESNPFVHKVLTHYKFLSGKPALVNTSFNIHEEPIVCSPVDALQGFFESGLDYLYLEGGFLVSFDDNKAIALKFLQRKLKEPSQKSRSLAAIVQMQSNLLLSSAEELVKKESAIQQKELDIRQMESVIQEKERCITELADAIKSYRLAFWPIRPFFPLLRVFARAARGCTEILRPSLGNLNQYKPRPLSKSLIRVGVQQLTATPKLSIVTPSFQQGRYIERTIVSVMNQGYPNLEYFVQDGGSSDDTVAALKRYQGRLSGWISEKDRGQSQAINLGFVQTSGEIMGWLNSDDLLLPGALACVVDYFNRHPDVDVVYGNRLLIDESDMEIGRWIMPGHDSKVLSWVDYVPQETLFWRRSIWEKAGGQIDESFRFAMDWDLLVRFREAGAKFAHIPHFLGAFRIHEHQKTSAVINDIGHQEMNRIRERVLGRLPTNAEIRTAVSWFMLKHILIDLAYRIRIHLKGRR